MINESTKTPKKENSQNDWGQYFIVRKEKQCKFGVEDILCWRKKLPLFLTPRTSHLKKKTLYKTVRMTQQANWVAASVGYMLLWKDGIILSGPFWQSSSQTVSWKMGKFQLSYYIIVWSDVSNWRKSIPKRLSHSFVPMWAIQFAV